MRVKKIFFVILILLLFIIPFLAKYIISKYYFDNKVVSVAAPTSSAAETPKPSVTEEPKKDVLTDVTISSAGDCTLGNDDKFTYNTLPMVLAKHNNDYSYFFKNVSEIFKSDDFTTANLETTFTNSSVKLNKGSGVTYNFKGPASYAKALTLGSIEAVNISNNHIHDYLDKGVNDTISALNSNNIKYFGEGNKLITEIKGIKFGFLGYNGFSDNSTFLQNMKNDIQYLKSQNCVVVINIHWGIEGQYKPYAVQTHIAHYAVDNGADIIIGHHPHVIESIEQYKGKIICYSLGNFCFGGNANPPDKDTFILQTRYHFINGSLSSYDIKVIPCSISSTSSINDYCPTPLQGEKVNTLLNKLNSLSPDLKIKLTSDFTKVEG